MKPLKTQLKQMHQILVRIIILLFITITLSGCNNSIIYSNEMWLEQINNKLKIVNEDYYQNLIDYEIINKEDQINLEEPLTNTFVKYTLENLIKEDLENIDIIVIDDLIKIDEIKATKYLDKCIEYLNNLEFEKQIYEVEYKNIINNESNYIKENSIISKNSYKINDLLKINTNYYFLLSKNKENNYYIYKYRLASFEDVINKVKIQSSFNLNLNSIQILDDDSVEVSSDKNRIYFQQLGTFSTYRQIQRNGFEIYYSISNNSFHISVAREVKDGLKVFGEYDISNIKPNIKWDYDHKLDEAYFRVDYQTQQSIGVKSTSYFNRYLDIKKLKNKDSFNSLKDAFKSKEDLVETTIPILSFKAPIPECPLFYITMELRLHIYASGKMELSLSSKNQTGIEIKNNNLRIINNNYNDIDFIIHASGSSSIGLNFGLSALNYKLANFEIEAGAKGKIQTIVHLYDNDNITEVESDIPTDLVDYISSDNDEIFVCGDLSLYWLLNLQFNTNDTFLGKIGYYRKIDILNENNQILKNKMTHIENWQFVDECHYKNQENFYVNEDILISTNQILLNKYSMLIKEGLSESILIKGIPDDYNLKDLVYLSEDDEVCIVNNGIVTAIKKGATNIIVSTTDKKYKASISILVQDSN